MLWRLDVGASVGTGTSSTISPQLLLDLDRTDPVSLEIASSDTSLSTSECLGAILYSCFGGIQRHHGAFSASAMLCSGGLSERLPSRVEFDIPPTTHSIHLMENELGGRRMDSGLARNRLGVRITCSDHGAQ